MGNTQNVVTAMLEEDKLVSPIWVIWFINGLTNTAMLFNLLLIEANTSKLFILIFQHNYTFSIHYLSSDVKVTNQMVDKGLFLLINSMIAALSFTSLEFSKSHYYQTNVYTRLQICKTP